MSNWHNVSKKEPCPICHKTDWCNLSNDGAVCICHRVESDHPTKSGYGWIHRLRENETSRTFGTSRTRWTEWTGTREETKEPTLDFCRVHGSYDEDPVLVEGLATTLGVDDEVLKALDVRFNRFDECWSFPMRDAEGQIVGLRFRELGGSKKWSARGSKDGLFYAANGFARGDASKSGREMVVVEGPSDTAAGMSLGLNVVGRSSCQTGAALLRGLICRARPRIITIVADNDTPGIKGAEMLTQQLNAYRESPLAIRVLVVPSPYKDLRAWYLSGGLTPKLFADVASAQRWQ